MPDLVLRLVLPLPPRELSPNARVHWIVRAKANRAAKEAVHALSLQQRPRGKPLARATVSVTFWVPDRRRRDKGNLIGAAKAYLDGLKDAGVIQDDAWQFIEEVYPPVEYHKGESKTIIEVVDA